MWGEGRGLAALALCRVLMIHWGVAAAQSIFHQPAEWELRFLVWGHLKSQDQTSPPAAPSSSELGNWGEEVWVGGFFFFLFSLARKIWYLHLVEEVRREVDLFRHVGLRLSCAALPWGATLSCFVHSFVIIVEYWHLSIYWVLIH